MHGHALVVDGSASLRIETVVNVFNIFGGHASGEVYDQRTGTPLKVSDPVINNNNIIRYLNALDQILSTLTNNGGIQPLTTVVASRSCRLSGKQRPREAPRSRDRNGWKTGDPRPTFQGGARCPQKTDSESTENEPQNGA
jgi:hypothetical protein